MLGRAEGGLAAYATALLNWHRSHRYCPNCGSETDVAEAGLVRRRAASRTIPGSTRW